jgi:hypothetical protein
MIAPKLVQTLTMLAVTCAALCVAPAGAAGAEPSTTTSATTPTPSPGVVNGVTTDQFLDRLERADADLTRLSTKIQRIRTFSDVEGGGRHLWRGELLFRAEPRPGAKAKRMFAVRFTSEIVSDAKRDIDQTYVFDGTWLLERQGDSKQYVRRRVVAEGSDADPLRIGEGPIPMPIGQRADDLRARFDVLLVPALEGVPEGEKFARLREMLSGCWQVRLTPREGSPMARDFRDIRLWYRSEDLLPVFAQTQNTNDTRDEVLLIQHDRQADIDAAAFSTRELSTEDGWSGRVEEFRAARPAPALPVAPAAPDAPAPAPGEAPTNAPTNAPTR